MAGSHSGVYIHYIWSTKGREPLLTDQIRTRFHEYTCGIFRELESTCVAINSRPDHVHALCRLSRKLSLADLAQEVKSSTSKWMKDLTAGKVRNFHWQAGYGAFSVSASNLANVVKYIDQQETHHRKCTFQEEYLQFYKKV